MSNILFKQMSGQVNVDEAEGIVECFVAGIGNKDSVGDICAPGAFNASLRRRTPRVVWGHDWNQPIGKVLEIYEVPASDPRLPKKMKQAGIGGLYARVQFNLKSERGREAFASISFFGMDQEWSIGYKTLDAIFDNARQANILKEVELYEVSPVLHGANQLTGTISIKSDAAVMDEVEEKAGKKPLKDPKGGLTAAGREYFKRTEGANLKPGVKGPADTPEKMRRKGSFLTRFFTNPSGPLVGDNGKPTRLALSAAAWGEPVPKNAEDAAELAAKGRRLLERYKNQKEKDAKGHGYEDDDMKPAAGEGIMKMLGRAIANEMDAPVKIRTADDNMVIFDLMRNGEKQTYRMGYHYEDGDFMFGRSERVKPETVYMPVGESGPGHAFSGDEKSAEDDLADWIEDMIDFAYSEDEFGSKVDEDAIQAISDLVSSDIEVKVGRVLSGSNLEKLNQAIGLLREIAAAGGRADIEMKTPEEMIIPAEQKTLFDLRMHLDPIFDHYGAKVLCDEAGIIVKSLDGDQDGFEQAISTAMRSFNRPVDLTGDFEEKAIFRRGRRVAGRIGGGRIGGGRGGRGGRGRRGGSSMGRPSYDGDGDGFITNPVTGRDEIPWNKDKESPEDAIRRFFGGGRGLAPSKQPKATPLSDMARGVQAYAGFDKIKLGDVFPDNYDDASKKLGAPRWQILAINRRQDGAYELKLGDLSASKPGNRRTVVFAGDQQFPNVSRPNQLRVQRGETVSDSQGRRMGLEPFQVEDGMTPPFQPKPEGSKRPAQRRLDPNGDILAQYQAGVMLSSTGRDDFGREAASLMTDRELDQAIEWRKKRNESGNLGMSGVTDLQVLEQEKAKRSQTTTPTPFNWPKDQNNRVKEVADLSDEELSAALKYWQGVPASEKTAPGIRNLVNALEREDAQRKAGTSQNAQPMSMLDRVKRAVNWKGWSKGAPSGAKAVDYGKGDYGRYWVVDADQAGGTPGKYVIEGQYSYDYLGNVEYFDGWPEFDTPEEAMEWAEKFEQAFDDGNIFPEDPDFEWPDDPTPSVEDQTALNEGRSWKVRVPNKPAKGKNGSLGRKERAHNFIASALDDARALFAQKWLDRRKNRNIDQNIEFADDRLNELQVLANKLDNQFSNNFPGFEEGYYMNPVDYARMAVDQGWVDTIAEGMLLHEELLDAWDQHDADLEEIGNMMDEIQKERQKFVDQFNTRYEGGNPDFPEYFDR